MESGAVVVLASCEAYLPRSLKEIGCDLNPQTPHNPLCTKSSQISSSYSFRLFWDSRIKTASGKKGGAEIPMEKLPKAYEKEYMKMAMLKHEQTFKQQVHELHRLYRTQKTLMKNVEKSRQSGWNPESLDKRNEICFRQIYEEDAKKYYRSKLDLEQPAEDETEANNGALPIMKENELELTLGPSSYNTSDSGVTNSSSSTGSSHEGSPGYQNGSNRAQKKMLDYPPWLFQVVSLNMT